VESRRCSRSRLIKTPKSFRRDRREAVFLFCAGNFVKVRFWRLGAIQPRPRFPSRMTQSGHAAHNSARNKIGPNGVALIANAQSLVYLSVARGLRVHQLNWRRGAYCLLPRWHSKPRIYGGSVCSRTGPQTQFWKLPPMGTSPLQYQ
jgi:hypothetical protein